MPLYEFSCQHCGSINEVLMNMSSPQPEACEKCQGGPLVKIISRSNFALKGKGWYETDFKNKNRSPIVADATSELAAADASAAYQASIKSNN
jgi:putative FmdB family regulatory protein